MTSYGRKLEELTNYFKEYWIKARKGMETIFS